MFGIPADVLTNLNVEISDLLGVEGSALAERILACSTTEARVDTMVAFLLSRLSDTGKPHSEAIIAAANFIIAQKGNVNVVS